MEKMTQLRERERRQHYSSSFLNKRPLNGVRILDLSRLYPGPLCTLLLSDLGCEVIKIEDNDPGKGDNLRQMPPLLEKDGIGLMYHSLNRGKKSIALNLRFEADREQFLTLLKSANVVVESFRPGVLERLFHTDNIMDTFHKYQPSVILARISAYGQNAPDTIKYMPAHDMNSQAHAGVFGISKKTSKSATVSTSPLPIQGTDLLCAYTCALQITAAIFRQKTDPDYQGQVIDVSMFDVSLSSIMMPMSILFTEGDQNITSEMNLLCGIVPAYDIYRCKSGFITVGCIEPHFWKAFITILGLSEEIASAKSMFLKDEQKEQLKKEIEAVLVQKTAEEWENIFTVPHENKLGVQLPIIRIRDAKELLHEPLVKIRNMLVSFPSSKLKVIKPALDYTSFLKEDKEKNVPAVPLGYHNEQILSRL
jgi:crotonobetainyl-CoA:carnitine CoA-transferase CaiB-like acyl-CoA transferase